MKFTSHRQYTLMEKVFEQWLYFVFFPNNAHISECVLNKSTCIVVVNNFNELFT